MKRIAISRLPELLEQLAAQAAVYSPLDDGGGHSRFSRWEPGRKPVLTGNTRRGPKDLFFPQVEDLVRFRVSGKELEVLEARVRREPFVVFGVRACDCRALEILDRVFLAEPEDSFYKDRREHGTVVSLACREPEETCFCRTFGIDAADPAGDVTAWEAGDYLYFRPNTEKGERLLSRLVLEEREPGEVEAAQAALRAVLDRLPLADLTTQGFGRRETCWSCFTGPNGRPWQRAVWAAAPAPMSVPPASVTTSKNLTTDGRSAGTGAGIVVCTPILPSCPPVSPVPRRRSGSGSVLCTSCSTFRSTRRESLAALAAAGACSSARCI